MILRRPEMRFSRMRSSREWNVIIQKRPPGASSYGRSSSHRHDPSSTVSSPVSPSIRMAWKCPFSRMTALCFLNFIGIDLIYNLCQSALWWSAPVPSWSLLHNMLCNMANLSSFILAKLPEIIRFLCTHLQQWLPLPPWRLSIRIISSAHLPG